MQDSSFVGSIIAGNPLQFNLASAMAVGDLNGEGKPDLTFADDSYYVGGPCSQVGGRLGVGLNIGSPGHFELIFDTHPSTLWRGSAPMTVTIGDLNGDDHLDLVTTEVMCGAAFVAVFNDGANEPAFTGQMLSFPFNDNRTTYSPALADLDGDGKIEIIFPDPIRGPVIIFNTPNHFRVPYPNGGGQATVVAAADLDGDGAPEIITQAADVGSTIIIIRNGSSGDTVPPIAQAGSDQNLRPGSSVHLDGSASYDDNTASRDLTYTAALVVPNAGAVSASDRHCRTIRSNI